MDSCMVCDGGIGHFAEIVDVAGHAVHADVGLGFGEFFVQKEEFLQEGSLGHGGAAEPVSCLRTHCGARERS